MGSLTSRPKTPAAVAQTVYLPVPQYVSTPVTTVETSTTSSGTTTPSTTTDTAASPTATPEAKRQAGLLDRSRGVLSTVMTSFRGILDDSVAPSPHKTLLGE